MPENREMEAINAFLGGEKSGLQFLYKRYSERVFRTCYRILGEHAAAEDATQEVFIRVARKLHSFNGRSLFSTWIYRISVNQSLNALKKRKSGDFIQSGEIERELAPKFSEIDSPERILAAKEQRESIQNLLQRLKPEHRVVLVLKEIEGLGYREIAETLKVPQGTVMSRISRGRKEFKKMWTASVAK